MGVFKLPRAARKGIRTQRGIKGSFKKGREQNFCSPFLVEFDITGIVFVIRFVPKVRPMGLTFVRILLQMSALYLVSYGYQTCNFSYSLDLRLCTHVISYGYQTPNSVSTHFFNIGFGEWADGILFKNTCCV